MQRILVVGIFSLLLSSCAFSMGVTKAPSNSPYEKDREELIKALNTLSSRISTLEETKKE